MIRTENSYFRWLLDLIGGPKRHISMLNRLFELDFFYTINMDSNREGDGLYLRDLYSYERMAVLEDIPDGNCTFLEFLVGLAYRLENDIMHDDDFGDRTGYWFWIFIENLGLDRCNLNEIDGIVEDFCERRYGRDGSGGIFPLKNPKKDQRRVEIWYQMHAWLNEYFLNFE